MQRTVMLSLLMLSIAACSPESGGNATTTSDGGAPITTQTTQSESTTTTSLAETTTTAVVASGGDECVEGTWALDTESFISSMAELFAAEGFAGDVTPNDGEYLVTLDPDGTFTAERTNWGFSVDTSEGTFVLTINGTDEGIWSVDGTTMSVDITSSDVTSQSQVEVDGQQITMPEAPVQTPDAVAENSQYTCDGDDLVVMTEDIEIAMTRES